MAPFTPVSSASAIEEAPASPAIRPTFDAVFHECGTFVWRVVQRLGVRPADVEDVCQEVFVVVHRRLESLATGSSARTWVYAICLRVASDYRRRAHHRHETLVDPLPDGGRPAEQDAELERRRALAWLDRQLAILDEPKRVAFVLHEIEQIPMTEVAEVVGCPLQTAYARLYAAKKHIDAAARREQARRSTR